MTKLELEVVNLKREVSALINQVGSLQSQTKMQIEINKTISRILQMGDK